MLALQIERHYTKDQIFTMYCNQIYLGAGNLRFRSGFGILFQQAGRPVDACRGRDARGHHSRADLFADHSPGSSARAPESGALAYGARAARSREAVAESTAKQPLGLHRRIAAQRSGALFRRRDSPISRTHVRHGGGARTGPARLHDSECGHAESGGPRRSRRAACLRSPPRLARQSAEYSSRQSRNARHLPERRLEGCDRKRATTLPAW